MEIYIIHTEINIYIYLFFPQGFCLLLGLFQIWILSVEFLTYSMLLKFLGMSSELTKKGYQNINQNFY